MNKKDNELKCESYAKFEVRVEDNESDEQKTISVYLTTHPVFAKEWYVKNISRETLREWLNVRPDTSISNDNNLLLSNCNDLQTSDAKQMQINEDLLTASYAEMVRGGRNSVTSDLFHEMVECCPRKRKSTVNSNGDGVTKDSLADSLQDLDEDELFMKLISDITNELDIDTLCHKILVNVSILTKSDRVSIFLAKGSRDQRYLVPKLFDVTSHSVLKEALSAAEQTTIIPPLPFGTGIAGHVALTKETVNIEDAYQDNRFNKEIDVKTGYHTKAIICQPILNFSGDVIGVAECINKTNDQSFNKKDEQVFQKYLTFCGIGLQNAQLFEMSVSEYKRNQLLLSLAHSIFEETSSFDALINKIMMKAQGLLHCDKCRVYLVDIEGQQIQEEYSESFLGHLNVCKSSKSEDIIFSSVFELNIKSNEILKFSGRDDWKSTIDVSHINYARQVVVDGQTFKCNENCGQFDCSPGIVCEKDYVLSVPIFDNQSKVIGVAQLVRIQSNPFNEVDISTLEAFSIFCGLGIHNSLTYEKAVKLTAKQKVALEVLSYHASASIDETKKLINLVIPEANVYQLYTFEFCDFEMDERDTCLATLRMFFDLNLNNTFKIPYQVLCRWVLSVKKNYRPVIYHNWRHALNVTQTMFAILTVGNMSSLMNEMEKLALIVASLCHDLDHRGTNNSFQTKTGSALATLYGTSIMENHHFNHCILILNSEGNNILQSLSPEDYKEVIHIIESCILSTDLDQYFQKKNSFIDLVRSGEKSWREDYKKDLLRGILMTACDISATFKPWSIQKKIAELVAREFFEQGDLEKKELNEIPSAMMDRDKKDELPIMQVAFIDLICLPVYQILSECWPVLMPLYKGCLQNREQWKQLSEENM